LTRYYLSAIFELADGIARKEVKMHKIAKPPYCDMCKNTGIYTDKSRCPKCCGYGAINNILCSRCKGVGYIKAQPIPCPFCKIKEEKYEHAT